MEQEQHEGHDPTKCNYEAIMGQPVETSFVAYYKPATAAENDDPIRITRYECDIPLSTIHPMFWECRHDGHYRVCRCNEGDLFNLPVGTTLTLLDHGDQDSVTIGCFIVLEAFTKGSQHLIKVLEPDVLMCKAKGNEWKMLVRTANRPIFEFPTDAIFDYPAILNTHPWSIQQLDQSEKVETDL